MSPGGKRLQYVLASLLSLVAGAGPAPAVERDATLDMAERLFESGDMDNATTEYLRWLYRHPDAPGRCDVYGRIGEAYRTVGDTDRAVAAFERAAATAPDDLRRERARNSAAATLMAAGRLDEAEMELQRVAAFSPSDAARREAGMLMGVCHAFRGRWEEARRAYGAAPRGDNGALRDLVEARLAPGRMPRVRSPVAAAWLSTFIPGAGQMYAGDWKDGFNALGLNALTAFLLVEGVLDGRYGDVMFVHLAFFERFYFGNRDNARLAVEARNRRVNRTVAVRLMEDVARSVAAQSE